MLYEGGAVLRVFFTALCAVMCRAVGFVLCAVTVRKERRCDHITTIVEYGDGRNFRSG
jgi:hypothetical protein